MKWSLNGEAKAARGRRRESSLKDFCWSAVGAYFRPCLPAGAQIIVNCLPCLSFWEGTGLSWVLWKQVEQIRRVGPRGQPGMQPPRMPSPLSAHFLEPGPFSVFRKRFQFVLANSSLITNCLTGIISEQIGEWKDWLGTKREKRRDGKVGRCHIPVHTGLGREGLPRIRSSGFWGLCLGGEDFKSLR